MDIAPSQEYAGASDVPITISSENVVGSSSSFEDHYYDPELDPLLNCFGDYSNSQCFVNDFFQKPATFVSNQNESGDLPPSAPSECKVQPRVYNRSPSLILSYTPPPSVKVVELQYSPPAQPDLPAHVPTPFRPAQPFPADVSAMASASHPISDALADSVLLADVVYPSHFLHADVASDVSTPNMPPQQQPSPYPNFNTHRFDACCPINVMGCRGSQSHDPHHNFCFGISDVQAKRNNQLPYDIFHDRSKVTAPMSMHHQYLLPDSMKRALPYKLEDPKSPVVCVTSSTASPTYLTFSMADNFNSAATEISSSPAPAAPATSNSSVYWTSTPPQRTSLSVPPSPTPSVNKKESPRSSPHGISQVAFRVKTKLLNLHDGFQWKKYGEKIIKKEKHPRSYFKCDEKDRCRCKALKRTQRCSHDEGYVVFTYVGRHNHS